MQKQTLYILLLSLIIFSCNKTEEIVPREDICSPTYIDDIKAITDNKCATSGCHDRNSSLVTFTDYQTLKTRADNGRLQSHVIEKKIMPPASAEQLTDTELETFKCWLENGAPES